MDEFASFHALACLNYPLNSLNTFRESCTGYDLAPIPNLYLPLRSYHYEGSVSGLIYFPLFKLWPSPYSGRLLGMLMLLFQAYCLRKLFNTNLTLTFLLLLYFMPYVFQHIVDYGAAAINVTSVYLICLLIRKWIVLIPQENRRSWLAAMGIGLLMFLGVWIKLTYFFIIPALSIMALYHVFSNRPILDFAKHRKKLFKDLMLLALSFAVPTFILLNAFDRSNHRYYEWIVNSPVAGFSDHETLWNHFIFLSKNLTNPLQTAQYLFRIGETATPAGILYLIDMLLILSFGCIVLLIKRENWHFPLIHTILFALSLLLVSYSLQSWGMHHLIYGYPFLILGLFHVGSKLYRSGVIGGLLLCFILLNASFYFELAKLDQRPDSRGGIHHPSLVRLNETLNQRLGDKYVFVCIDWGMYFMKSLYGPKNQCVLYIEPLDSLDHIHGIKNVLRKTKRKVAFIGLRNSVSNLSLIRTSFPNLATLKTDFDTGLWRVWYEP